MPCNTGSGGLLTKRALMLAKVETTCGVDANPTPTDDAILVSEPDYTTDPQVLERDFVSNDLSKFEDIIGRVVAGFTFTMDVRGNGIQNSGLVADAPKLATVLQGCGYVLEPMDGGVSNVSDVIANKLNDPAAPAVAWDATGSVVTVNNPVLYTIEVTTAGASGVAEVTITNNNTDEDDLSAAVSEVITTATPLNLGGSGATLTPTWTGNLSLGDKWQAQVWPTGVKARPTSDAFDALTLVQYRDGIEHRGLAGMGTFTIDATAGEYATASFQFTTTFIDAVDTPLPSNPVYETTLPPQVEISYLSWGGKTDLFAESWSFDQGNELNPRLDVNAPQGYLGTRITDRAPSGGFTPEMQLEADASFWADFLAGRAKTFSVRVGTERGNMVCIFAPNAQTSEQPYTDRNGVIALDKSVNFKRGNSGDDEIIFVFC